MKRALSSWPKYSEEEAEAVKRVLLSNKVNYWTGDIGRQFEADFAKFSECKYTIALANGTVALDLALHGLSLGSNNGGSSSDEIIVTPRSFIASISTVINAGAKPVFVDVDRDSQNIEAQNVAEVISQNTRAIICVHLAGWPCDIDAIKEVIENRNIKIIEDCAQSHGAKYKGKSVGGLGDIGAWSFCQDKIMTTGGEGGMVTCNDENIWRRMWAYKDHGKSHKKVFDNKHASGFRWLHESFGTNWRITEMQSVIGRIQLKRMPDWTRIRARNATIFSKGLEMFSVSDGPIRIPRPKHVGCGQSCLKSCWHANYKYYVFIRPENLKESWSRSKVVDEISHRGVPCFQGSCPEVYLENAFKDTSFKPEERLEIAKELGETSLSLCIHPSLDELEIHAMLNIISEVLESASRT